ncbi:major capsid protein [Nonomuraea sp. NEAU-A123]|uniref:major capsid protein n=1 Tax=Nonomuraea sp. NEAU-A123 TaxID=2839649 RepID=UPI001BE4B9D4|nr:major capsid protein [Nonomuraea sp. NEAU-A123]MBT2226264.1 major capsid protein [Nonomuraea sp. NEAU-A123]
MKALGDADKLAALLARDDLDLGALEAAALEMFQEIRARQGEGLSGEDVAALEQLAEGVEALRSEGARRDQAAADQAAAVDAIAARITPPAPADELADDEPAPVDDQAPTDAPVDEPALEPVAASGGRRRPPVDLSAIAARSRKPAGGPNDKASGPALIAAANVPGIGAGARYRDVTHIAEAAIATFASYPTPGADGRASGQLAVIRKEFEEGVLASGGEEQIEEALKTAVDQSKLKGGSLTAAGGWCAPSEILYDLCEPETTAGLISVPEIVATRGGFQWTRGPDFRTIYNHTGNFIQTEAQAEAATQKPCFEIPCAAFNEVRLDAIGFCLSAGILTNRAYPEMVARFIRGALTAHAHRYAASTIARMVAGSTAVALPAAPFSASVDLLGSLELQAWDYRYGQRLDPDATLELIAPYWLLGVLRSDLAKRNGYDNALDVSNAEINAWLTLRGFAPQWVYNWQDRFVDGAATIGAPTAPTVWPASVKVLIYAAGVWVRATQDILTLNTLYDSTNIRLNRYNAMFSEEGLAMMQRCYDSRVVTIPICANGASAEQIAVTCPSI